MRDNTHYHYLAFFLFLTLLACRQRGVIDWFRYFPDTGTYSSPAVADLNGDGILDIIIGAGAREDQPADTGIIALDGSTGNLLWSLPTRNQMVGKACFQDINGDGIPEVFIGGRWAEFYALDGKTGRAIWSFFPERIKPDPSYAGWYNFSSAQWIKDQDGDGFSDLVVANGGDSKLLAGDTVRPAGKLLILSSASGNILASITVPDQRETYMSPVVQEISGADHLIYFGSGGETIGGALYQIRLSALMQGDNTQSVQLLHSKNKGFVAPPVLADITQDGSPDIIINSADGEIFAVDGSNHRLLWQHKFPGTESYTVPAPGFFNSDSIPDFFSNFAIGTFPDLRRSVRVMIDGSNGTILFSDTINSFQYASPLSLDLNGDGLDEVLLYSSALKRRQFDEFYYSYIEVIDFVSRQTYALSDSLPATNLASTPWIGDLDGNGSMEMIYSAVKYQDINFNLARPLGLLIGRKALPAGASIRWGAYMGSNGNGKFNWIR